MENDLLTQEEVNNLPLGTEVYIIWSGGNGPHKYTILDKKGELSCVTKHNPNAGWWDGEIDFVGSENYHTKVSLKPLKSR